jgi:hypothetical protein
MSPKQIPLVSAVLLLSLTSFSSRASSLTQLSPQQSQVFEDELVDDGNVFVGVRGRGGALLRAMSAANNFNDEFPPEIVPEVIDQQFFSQNSHLATHLATPLTRNSDKGRSQYLSNVQEIGTSEL